MGSLRLGTSTAGQETARGVLRGQRRRRGHLLTTPLCLMGPVWAFFLFIALGKLRLMRNFDLPESCRKIYTGLEPRFTPRLSYFQSYTQAFQGNRERESPLCAALCCSGERGNQEPQRERELWGDRAGVQGAPSYPPRCSISDPSGPRDPAVTPHLASMCSRCT